MNTHDGQEAVYTSSPCLYCKQPTPAPKRRGVVKRFCRPSCRAAHRDLVIQSGLRQAIDAIGALIGDLEQQAAALEGARLLLTRALRSGPRKRNEPTEKDLTGPTG